MIRKCDFVDEATILTYIGSNYSSCLYLYLDLKKYGLNSDKIEVFIQLEGDNITAVMLKYYSCLHVYSNNNCFNAKELAEFFENNCLKMLYTTAKTADRIRSSFSNECMRKASIMYGWVAQIEANDKLPKGIAENAEKDDFDQIVQLIYSDDDIGKSYNYEDLAKQIEERNKEGYARNLVIRDGSIVIAHACTNAEIDNIAVVAELLVRVEYRRKGYASEIWRDITHQLLNEGKEVYSFYYSDESRSLHKHLGFFEICEWAKIVID